MSNQKIYINGTEVVPGNKKTLREKGFRYDEVLQEAIDKKNKEKESQEKI